jgi:excinuclease ABC subunit C
LRHNRGTVARRPPHSPPPTDSADRRKKRRAGVAAEAEASAVDQDASTSDMDTPDVLTAADADAPAELDADADAGAEADGDGDVDAAGARRGRRRRFDPEAVIERLPTEPGVYLMKDKKGRVIYVGKAKDLRARVAQYFRGADERLFVATGLLARLVGDIETIVVGNEKEALLLENNLIKQHNPRFNVKLTDDKNYIVLRIDPARRFPRVEVVRKIGDDGARYFGPYHSATSARETLRVVNRHFQLRTCTDHVLEHRQRPCILHQIKRCPAPCVLPLDPAAYAEQVEDAALFLAGKRDDLVPRLKTRMKEAATALAYERAAQLRDQLYAVENAKIAQNVVQREQLDQDVIGFHRVADVVEVVVLFMRQGKLIGRRSFRLTDQEIPDSEVVRGFVKSYYELGPTIPDEVLLPLPIDDADVLADWLRERRGSRVLVFAPERGPKVRLVELAHKNAQAQAGSRRGQSDALAALAKLERRLGLRALPRRIECFDIAHLQGAATVASMVVFHDGEPARQAYRRFKVKTVTNDDFAAMYEVLSRRFRRARDGVPGWEAPDLLVVDGGKGQLGTALAALRDLGFDMVGERGFDAIGLAKERDDAEGEAQPDRVYLRGVKDPVKLRPSSTELMVLARIRDEAHRFANTFHRSLRDRRTLRSSLDDVPGVGQKRKVLLLRTFGSVKKIREASADELAAVPGMSKKAAQAVVQFFHGGGSDGGAAGSAAAEAPAASPASVQGSPSAPRGAAAVAHAAEGEGAPDLLDVPLVDLDDPDLPGPGLAAGGEPRRASAAPKRPGPARAESGAARAADELDDHVPQLDGDRELPDA